MYGVYGCTFFYFNSYGRIVAIGNYKGIWFFVGRLEVEDLLLGVVFEMSIRMEMHLKVDIFVGLPDKE